MDRTRQQIIDSCLRPGCVLYTKETTDLVYLESNYTRKWKNAAGDKLPGFSGTVVFTSGLRMSCASGHWWNYTYFVNKIQDGITTVRRSTVSKIQEIAKQVLGTN